MRCKPENSTANDTALLLILYHPGDLQGMDFNKNKKTVK